jgi:hypothetical protein
MATLQTSQHAPVSGNVLCSTACARKLAANWGQGGRLQSHCKIHGSKGPASSGTLACISMGYFVRLTRMLHLSPSYIVTFRHEPLLPFWLRNSGTNRCPQNPSTILTHFTLLHFDTTRYPFALPAKVLCLARIEPTTSGPPRNGYAGAATNERSMD